MTVLFGAVGLSSPLDPDAAQAMLLRMRSKAQGRDEPAPFREGSCRVLDHGPALGVAARPVSYMGNRTVPLARDGQLWMAARARLDTRDELLSGLGLPPDSPLDDAGLILAAYRRYGVDVVQHLVGDWAFALWDGERKRLLLARDATGNSALYWWQGAGQLIFASSLPTQLAAGPVPSRPNPRWIAGLLAVFSDPGHPTATAFEDIHSMPPGHLLLAENGRIDLQRWWRPEFLAPLNSTPLPELEARFLALYDDAVRKRLRRTQGSVAATLSGGLDSGSVVALAAPALAEVGESLTAFVHTPRFDASAAFPRRTTNEWELAQATAQHVGNVRMVACATEHISPVESIRQWFEVAGAPSHVAGNWYWLLDIARQARASGARVLLTGQGGNMTVSYNGTGDLWPRIGALRLGMVWHELRTEEAGWVVALQSRLFKPAMRPAWQCLKRMRATRGDDKPWANIALLNRESPYAADLETAMASCGHDPTFSQVRPERVALWRLGLHRGADGGGAAWAELGAAHGIEVRDPTKDQRLVELCCRLPDELFWSHGRKRGMIRTAMRSRLPTVVRDCQRKGLQSADLRWRLQAKREELLAEVEAVSRHPVVRDWFDVGRLALSASAILDVDAPPTAGAVDAANMLRTLAAAMFVARHG